MPNMPLRHPPPFLKTQDGLLFPHPLEFLYRTQRYEQKKDGNNAGFHAADPDILRGTVLGFSFH